MAHETAGRKHRTCAPDSTPPLSLTNASRKENLDGDEIKQNAAGQFAADALSNHLVLSSIFSDLDNSDIESCCQVNTTWNSVADPLLVSYYDIKLVEGDGAFDEDDDDSNHQFSLIISKRATYKSEAIYYPKCNLVSAHKLLGAVQAEKVAVNLKIETRWCDENKSIQSFVSEIGNVVEKLYTSYFANYTKFWKLLVKYFPNLKHLDITESAYIPDDSGFDANLMENQMKYLKRIDIFPRVKSRYPVVNILRKAPNLEEIYSFPILLVDTLVETEKAGCLRSLYYPHILDDNIQLPLETLASLDIKLQCFSFEYLRPPAFGRQTLVNETMTQPFVQRILQSSSNSLQSLILYKSSCFDFKAIPPMRSLKEVVFLLDFERSYFGNNGFGANLVLPTLFPNVSIVNIRTTDSKRYPEVARSFPINQFGQWGSRIDKLILTDVSAKALPQLSSIFPSIKDMVFLMRGIKTTDLRTALSVIGGYWPRIEFLTIVIADSDSRNQVGRGQCSFDSVFTGLPDEIAAPLKDPVSRRNLSPEGIENYKGAFSTFKKLTCLKKLNFRLDTRADYQFMQKLASVTPFSKEFGFDFLPELKLVVQTYRDERFGPVSRMKASLTPLVRFHVERLA